MESIPFHVPSLDESDIPGVLEVLRSRWITTGAKCREFESAFGEYLGGDVHCVSVNSGTAAMHLGLEALGIQSGDLVLTPVWTFTATAEVIRYLGAHPLFVDVDPETFLTTPEAMRAVVEKLSPADRARVRGMIPVHYGGYPSAMNELEKWCRQEGWALMDDAAHALPCKLDGQHIGQFGDVTAFSFYATKTLCTGEGGMAVTRSEDLAQRMRTMRLHGISRDVFDRYRSSKPSWFYEVVAPGYKYNMTDIAASLGISQLSRIDDFLAARRKIAATYDEGLARVEGVRIPPPGREKDLHAWHLYPLRIQGGRETRDAFIEEMSTLGISTSVHFIPLHLQPYYRDRYDLRPEQFPGATELFSQEVSLPIYPAMTPEQIDRVIAAVPRALERARRKTAAQAGP